LALVETGERRKGKPHVEKVVFACPEGHTADVFVPFGRISELGARHRPCDRCLGSVVEFRRVIRSDGVANQDLVIPPPSSDVP
jgi:hypothetical protein